MELWTKYYCSKKNAEVLSFTNGTVSDISKKIPEIADEHPTVKYLIIHTRALDVVKQQSEVLKQEFIDLLNNVQWLNTKVLFSGPLPTVRQGDERFSRLMMLNRWLKDTCAAQSVNFIDNFTIFWVLVNDNRQGGQKQQIRRHSEEELSALEITNDHGRQLTPIEASASSSSLQQVESSLAPTAPTRNVSPSSTRRLTNWCAYWTAVSLVYLVYRLFCIVYIPWWLQSNRIFVSMFRRS